MRLTELEPTFLRRSKDVYVQMDVALPEAEGIQFLCPKCFRANKGRIGTHIVICWSPVVPLDVTPGPGRWKLVGTGFHDLSLVGEQMSSVKLTAGCLWHGNVTKGEVDGV